MSTTTNLSMPLDRFRERSIKGPFLREPLDDFLHPGRRFWTLGSSYRLFLLRALRVVTKTYFQAEKAGSLVDLGCGSMPYRSLFSECVESYMGVDLNENEDADLFFEADFSAPLKSAAADVVLSTQVLEHVTDVDKYLQECARLLKRNGLLILSTHGVYNWHPAPIDLRRWTWQGLEYELGEAGLECVEMIPVGGPLAIAANMVARLACDTVPRVRVLRPIILSVIYTACNLFMRMTEPLTPLKAKYMNSHILLAVARKP